METLIVDHREVRRLLPMDECIEVMAQALATLAKGEAVMPLRGFTWLPDRRGLLASMPSLLPAAGVMGMKVISVFPGNVQTPFDSHQGVVLLFETHNGQLLAIIDATEITAIRTAAVSAVATRLLAREDAGDLAILGSGTQARTHLEAMMLVRPIRRVRAWSRNPDHARQFAEDAAREHRVDVEMVPTPREAVAGADLICTTTSSPEPVLLGEWIEHGAHVNAVGFGGPSGRELDTSAVARSRLYVDRRESAANEGGEFIRAVREGIIGDDHIVGEIGEVVLGVAPGRVSAEDITLFRSLGLAVEDLAAARHVYGKATEAEGGIRVDLVGGRHGGFR
jgi:ornithine cyclodeaminase/alanine dehydrogenase-like protein (mu-crystallin family)